MWQINLIDWQCVIAYTEPYTKLKVDDIGWTISYLWKAIPVKHIESVLHSFTFPPSYSICKHAVHCVKKNYMACAPCRISLSMVVYRRKMLSVMLLNDRELTVFSSGSCSLYLSLPLHLSVPSIAHLSCSLPWAGHFVLVLPVSSSSSWSSSSSSLPGPSVSDKLFVGMLWGPRAAHSCTQRTSIDPACGST